MNRLAPVLFILVLLAACKPKKEAGAPAELSPVKPGKLFNKMMKHQKEYESFSARAKVRYDDGEQKQSLTAGLRYKKDSAFLAMLSATLGIEVARMKVADDTVRIIDRLNKNYIVKSVHEYGDFMPFPLQLKLLEDVILGNVFIEDKGDISSSVEKQFHVLTINGTQLNTTVWLQPGKFTKDRMIVEDKASGRNLIVRYSDYRKKKGKWFPFAQEIRFEGGKQISIDLNLARLTLNDEVSFPFKVSDRYKQKN